MDMIAETIKEIREKRELTQQELANKVGCKKLRILEIENGKGASIKIIMKIAEALECSIMFVSKKSRYYKSMTKKIESGKKD